MQYVGFASFLLYKLMWEENYIFRFKHFVWVSQHLNGF